MAQFQWTVLGVTGKQYNVGLYHGDKSGHLLVHCNGNIVLTEFHVKETKNYSFFLDDELYELLVEKKEKQFGYALTPNKTADTPMNRRIWEREQSNLLKTIAFFAGFALLMFGLIYAIPRFQTSKIEKNKTAILQKEGKKTTARFVISEQDSLIRYFFLWQMKVLTLGKLLKKICLLKTVICFSRLNRRMSLS